MAGKITIYKPALKRFMNKVFREDLKISFLYKFILGYNVSQIEKKTSMWHLGMSLSSAYGSEHF